ncbi:hypothetical protein CM240_2820 [Clostridium bornimense]|uniref:DUF2975 domain-containing protein n=1 Tax=Clostridium bornimense TaxID=1216932 RepID=W6S6E2_9CLOT|nr:DUF2975 domain-containing protein [Clostridium bornimense]CDM69937.1 hypothetical protein CM240_2820 [Clostridium bornimense]
MRYYGKKSLASLLDFILTIVLVGGIILTAITYYQTITNNDIINITVIRAFLLLTIGIISIFIVVLELKKVIKTLVLENPFTLGNVKSLKRIAGSCFTVAGCYFVNFLVNIGKDRFKMIYVDGKGIHTDYELFVFLLAGCFIGILSKVFEQAVKYKEDNDLTI